MKGCNKVISGRIYGITNDVVIANVFPDKFSTLYNSAPSSEVYMLHLQDKINDKICQECILVWMNLPNIYIIYNIDDVIEAINKMKCNKRDGTCSVYSDHIINAGNKI